jgi:hypothetical protein
MVGLQMRKAHLDPLPLIARYQKSFRLRLATSYVASRLVDIPHDPTRGHVRATLLLQRALAATRSGGQLSTGVANILICLGLTALTLYWRRITYYFASSPLVLRVGFW